MKALSLWQPWATAIAIGAKCIETRSWSTKYRGPLAIHASLRKDPVSMMFAENRSHWIGALHRISRPLRKHLPFGAIVATCRLADCVRVETVDANLLDSEMSTIGGSWTERDMGDYSPGRFAWILEDIKPLALPFSAKGKQRLFDIPPIEGMCSVCGCTDYTACEGGCYWTDDDHTLCSRCESQIHTGSAGDKDVYEQAHL